MFGEKKVVRHNLPGMPKPASPFLYPPDKANLPPEWMWLRDFYNELSSDFLKRFHRMVAKCLLPFYQFPPFYHTVIDQLANIQVNVGATQTILTLTVPQDEMARIRFYTQDITAVVAPLPGTEWNEVFWSFLVNGVPLEDYDNFQFQRSILGIPAETTIILDGADIFTITARNTSAVNAYFCWAGIRGWRWSKLTTQLPDQDILEEL